MLSTVCDFDCRPSEVKVKLLSLLAQGIACVRAGMSYVLQPCEESILIFDFIDKKKPLVKVVKIKQNDPHTCPINPFRESANVKVLKKKQDTIIQKYAT